MNEMNKFPFKSFRLLGKNDIEIIPDTAHFPGLIWQNPVMIWKNPVFIWI